MALVVTECRRKNRSGFTGSYIAADRTYTEVWQVQTDGSDRSITGYDIEQFGENGETPTAGSPLPIYGSLLGSSGAVLKNKTGRQINDDDVSQWHVELSYGYITSEDRAGGSGQVNPILRLPDIRRTTTEVQEAIERDAEGSPLTLSNGRPFSVLPERTYYMPTLMVSQYEPTFSNSTASSVVGSVNSTLFAGFAPRTVLCGRMDATLVYWQDGQSLNTAVRVEYQFIHNKNEWTPGRYLARDYFEKSEDRLRPIVINGAIVTEPWPIDLNGEAVPPEHIVDGFAEASTEAAGGYHYDEVPLAEEFDFNNLPLPFQYL